MQNIFRKRMALMLSILMAACFIPTTSFASDTADTITYTVDAGEDVEFDGDDFNDVCQDLNDVDLDYVTFDLPSSSKGVLYYDYDGDDEDEIDDSDEYYYDEDDEDSISNVSFVADDDYSGSVTITYTGYDDDDNSYSGKVKITVSEDEDSGDITYTVDAGDDVAFDEDDFNDYCQDENDADLDYVVFDLPSSSKGVLYFDDDTEVDDDDKYYYDDDDENSISDITFEADDDYSGTCKIDFKGYDEDGDSIEGTIVITVSGDAGTADDIYLAGTEGSAAEMNATYFNNKCEDVTDETLDYIKFTLPSTSYGTLYYGYTSSSNYSSKVSASTKYYYSDQSPYISKVSFVPADGYTGTFSLKYTGYDTDGTSYTGTVKVTITENTASTATTAAAETTTVAPLPANAIAAPTSSKVAVNGSLISFDAYNINGNNYFKLRDIAYAVNGSAKQFGVSFDSAKNAITLTSSIAYVTAGGELTSGDGRVKNATLTTSVIYKDGVLTSLGAYNINGNNYFKLRDLAKAFNIGVTWNAAANTVEINTGNSYSE